MQVEFLTVCESASRTKTLTLTRVFETVTASSVPLVLPHLVAAAKIRLDATECGRKRFQLAITAPDSSVTDLLLAYERIERPTNGRPTVSHLILLPVLDLTLCCLGQYQLTLTVDRAITAAACFYVQLPQPRMP